MKEMKLKELVVVVLIGVALIGILFIGANRVEKIENGDMVLVNQNAR
jgi:ABC-type thiamin/hydroxymethylpyrimidine transport system permease subunit